MRASDNQHGLQRRIKMQRIHQSLARLLPAALPISLMGIVPAHAATKITRCPFQITVPGTYLVAADLRCGGTAIMITASNVDLHLGGHTLTGSGAGAGIDVEGAVSVSIHNGTVRGFYDGIYLGGAQNCKLSSLTVDESSDVGIYLKQTTGTTVTDNTITGSGDRGISVFSANQNTVTRNTASGNYMGISVSDSGYGNTVARNTCTYNTDGIRIWVGPLLNTFQDNTLNNNFYAGIHAFDGVTRNSFQNNTTNGNGLGIQLAAGCTCNTTQGNTALGNLVFDLEDDNDAPAPACANTPPGCANTWLQDTFQTAGGAGLACIH
jgi:parallel beta-helix repeat protein